MRKILALSAFLSIALSACAPFAYAADSSLQFSGGSYTTTVTSAALQAKYKAAGAGGPKVNVLIMPGHEPGYGGAVYGTLLERDLNVEIADKLAAYLKQNPRLSVTVARTGAAWNPQLESYFETGWQGILDFITDHKASMAALTDGAGSATGFQASHNTAAQDPARRLYGISKWANENGVDVAIHIHINDAGNKTQQGFAVYVPDVKYGNAGASRSLGNYIASELNRTSASSTLPIENLGVVGDQDLIALGAANTANFASVLIEYAYIYESKLANPGARSAVESDFAWKTYRGLQAFLQDPVKGSDTPSLPYAWKIPSPGKGKSDPQILALQIALHKLGFYPAAGNSLYDCPISGFNGTCTQTALSTYQKSKGWTPTGSIGPMTAAALKKAGF